MTLFVWRDRLPGRNRVTAKWESPHWCADSPMSIPIWIVLEESLELNPEEVNPGGANKTGLGGPRV